MHLILCHLEVVAANDCVKCKYMNWHPWESCHGSSEFRKQLKKPVCDIELCCPTSIFITNIDVCLSLCNITDPWPELLSDDLSKCHCYENKELLPLYVIPKLLILSPMLNFFSFLSVLFKNLIYQKRDFSHHANFLKPG